MPTQPTPTQPTPTHSSPFLERLITFLIPYFLPITTDLAAARAEIIETLASYGARTRAEMISAVQIIAFSFTALDVLAEAKAAEMSQSMRLRYRGCANNLNRSTQKNEDALAKRQASDPPRPVEPTADPIDDLTEAEVQEALRHAHDQIETYRRLPSNHPTNGPQGLQTSPEDLNKAAWTGAIIDALAQQGTSVRPPSPA